MILTSGTLTKTYQIFQASKKAYTTIQFGGELNAVLLRAGIIDQVLIVVAPCLIGGRTTATLVDGEPLHTVEDLAKIRPLKLKSCQALEDSYVRLEYKVVNDG